MKKSDFVVCDVHSFHEKFHTISELKSTLMNEFSSMLPESREFIFWENNPPSID